jgi:hypothetical protein
VVFGTSAGNLGSPNGGVALRDRQAGTTHVVRAPGGWADVSDTGLVVYAAPDASNQKTAVFRADPRSGALETVAPGPGSADGNARLPSISDDGTRAVFAARADTGGNPWGWSNDHTYLATLSAAPGAVPDTVVVIGSDNALWKRTSDAAGWSRLGGVLVDAPAVARSNGVTYYVGLGADRNVWVRTDARDWAPLGHRGTHCTSPAAAVSQGTIGVACTGADNALWVSRVALPADGRLPSLGSWTSFGGILKAGPSMSDASTDARPRFGYAVLGADNRPWARTDATHWTLRNDAACVGVVAVALHGRAAACRTPNEALRVFHKDSWTGTVVPGRVTGRTAVTMQPTDLARYYVLGTDGTIWVATQQPNGSVGGFSLWGGSGRHGLAAVSG